MPSPKFAAATLAVALVLGACQSTGTEVASADVAGFEIRSASVGRMTPDNLCRALGGSGAAPALTIAHSPVAGVPIRVRMYDRLSDGSTFEHRATTVRSDASGRTVLNHAFLPPCNTTGGRLDSRYFFDISAGAASATIAWARFDSGPRRIRN